MCGIAGYATLGSDRAIDPRWIRPMIETLRHRGPDHEGAAVFEQVAMANSRLAIQDIAGGNQPMANADESTVVVYNGELYNTPELRAELEREGVVFQTHCDTEVLIHLYDRDGVDFLEQLNGMFAVCVYDRTRQRVLLARDRFGVKPLVWSYHDGQLAFASEIKALRCLPSFDSSLSPEGLSTFLGLFYIPDPWTIYANVQKLRPGHFLLLDASGLSDQPYFQLDFGNGEDPGAEEAATATARLLEQSVRRQLLSDVPVGVLLSGGLDSRSMLAWASANQPATRAFTIGFEEATFDEGNEARYWARAFESKHETLLFDEERFCGDLLERQRHLDEPYALWCNVATGALAQTIREAGYKVVLSGEGGDELFLGYPTIHAANVARAYRHVPRLIREPVRTLVRALPAGDGRLPFTFKLKSFLSAIDPSLVRTFFGFKEVVRHCEWGRLLTPEAMAMVGSIDPAVAFEQHREQIADLHWVDALSYLDFKVFLPGCSFVGNDNAYMSESVETRVPMMDNDLVDFVGSLPASRRFHPTRLKPILRRALLEHAPAPPGATAERARQYRKNGFEIPAQTWLADRSTRDASFREMLGRLLSRDRVAKAGFFQPDTVRALFSDQLSGRQNNERVLQAIMSLNVFLEGSYEP